MSGLRTVIEPTALQLELMAGLVERADACLTSVDAAFSSLEAAADELKRQGAPGSYFFSFRSADEMARVYSRNARVLNATGGRWGFMEWLFYRVYQNSTIKDTFKACEEDQNRAVGAVEDQVRALDPELTTMLDRVALGGWVRNGEDYAERAGMTRAAVEDRAQAVLANLIESGWRP